MGIFIYNIFYFISILKKDENIMDLLLIKMIA